MPGARARRGLVAIGARLVRRASARGPGHPLARAAGVLDEAVVGVADVAPREWVAAGVGEAAVERVPRWPPDLGRVVRVMVVADETGR